MKPEEHGTISHYKILSKLGEGGMGEVYLAQDTTLERKVAVKMLNDECCEDSERLQRFVQEAKTASALNHPNIITIFEFGRHEDHSFMATEFVEGKELSKLIANGAMNLGQILDISIQIASALETAHEAGIIHRDVKPENIMLRSDGIIKVLDFGLAKLVQTHNGSSVDNEADTREKVLTDPGRIMGTPNYMSPEQTRGKAIDARTDIWSFGVVLYEMITGQIPFPGESVSDVIAAIIHKEPNAISQITKNCPAEFEQIIEKSLKKDRGERYQTIYEVKADLEALNNRLAFENELERSNPTDKTNRSSSFEEMVTKSQPITPEFSADTKEALVLTEFNNLTDESVFDGTLKMALAFTLAQSPFIEIFPETSVQKTLQLMGHPQNKTVSCKLAKEVCQRRGLKAYVAGTISSLGSAYVLNLEAINAQTGAVIGRGLEQADSKEQVLKALGKATSKLREQLGEELSSIEKFDEPLELTTSSLEALQVLTQGYQYYLDGKNLDAIPFYKRAVEIDPNFAYAYIELAVLHYNTDQPKQAVEYTKRAYELKDRVSELEKFRIKVFYHSHVTGEQEKSLEALYIHKQTYPKDYRVFAFLSDRHIFLGQFEKAISPAKESIRLNPKALVGHWNLMQALIGVNRFDEAKTFYHNTIEPHFEESIWAHRFMYQIALIEDDHKAMAKYLGCLDGQLEHLSLNLRAVTAGYYGQKEESLGLSRRAIDQAIQSNAKEVAAQYAAEDALRLAIWNTESDETLKNLAKEALELERNKITLPRIALALAFHGHEAEAQKLVDEMVNESPKDTLINGLWLPTIKAAMKLHNGNSSGALKDLENTKRYERAGELYPRYLRGLAYNMAEKQEEAAIEFTYIMRHRGEAPYSILPALAQVKASNDTE